MIVKNRWKVIPIAIAALGLWFEKANAQETATEAPPAAKEEFNLESYLASFDQVWETIRDTHWDPEVVGEKWNAAREEHRPRISESKSADEARQVLIQLLDELGQSHFQIIPAVGYAAVERQSQLGGPGYSGITVRWIDDAFVVVQVDVGSPADTSGIKPGWTIERLTRYRGDSEDSNVLTSEELSQEVIKSNEHSVARIETALGLSGAAFTSGAVGDKLVLDFKDIQGEPVEKTLELAKGPGQPAKLGNLPTVHVAFERRALGDGIGYLKFNAFLDAPRLIREFESTIKSPESKNGLVIDLRGNMGGLLFLTMGMSGWFVEEPLSLGESSMKGAKMEIKLNPRLSRYTAPVAVLIDECSISAAEVMSGGLQDIHVAKIFGSRSAGLVLPSTVVKLPSGDGFQYAFGHLKSASGRVLEGNGVEPDFPIELHRDSFLEKRDPVLETARDWLREQTTTP